MLRGHLEQIEDIWKVEHSSEVGTGSPTITDCTPDCYLKSQHR